MKQDRHGQAKVLSATEIEALFLALESARDKALFGVCLYTGCRISESCSLLTEDVYHRPGALLPTLTIRKASTKGKVATRQIPIHPQLQAYLLNYVPGPVYLFPGRHRHHGSLNPCSADAILREAIQRAGLVGVSTHSFRRTALTRLSESGVPLRVIQEISGHRSLAVLQRYLEVGPGQVETAISALQF
ncbi:site-specific integrase [Synechococcus sp. PCC 6312]|uniref:tyrosine-type recombinase/integrase n=1 Tax=Synechococcus sp. (strain ATCC 27167 / PCC 6312) TaxID=195253 RepID=UPI00029F26A4|nr:site-specific integrase [Synechococcus sp. PCC 6312]AFY62786.1 site-specific recombinase XerD [Synechococcus sp. PCC 6312]